MLKKNMKVMGFINHSLLKRMEQEKIRIWKKIEEKIKRFEEAGKGDEVDLFKELCFCILTANFSAERALKIEKEIGNGFLYLPQPELERKLRELGHRFARERAIYIVEARQFLGKLNEIIRSERSPEEIREWLAKNIKGIGFKEASHFLRNIGFKNLAIIDRHILNFLRENGLTKAKSSLTKKEYLRIESILKELAQKLGLNLAELDLLIWYMRTGEILK